MIQIRWTDRDGKEQVTVVTSIHLWEARGRTREHPDGTVIEGYRDGDGVIQLDVDDRMGTVYISDVHTEDTNTQE